MDKIAKSLEALKLSDRATAEVFRPVFYRLGDKAQRAEFEKLLQTPGLKVVDCITDQVRELIRFRNPSERYTREELDKKTKAHFGDDDPLHYGVWLYYPWSDRLVHLLDREEFIAVRTSRNQYKITPQERDELAKKKIGVIGLSVGQSVSVTLIMERICGEIRLADFDVLELTNLNRIRTGVHNLGLPKVYSVAREIAEIDPYVLVRCFPEGLREDNMDEFFLSEGKLDLVVEESDGFDIKILCRYKARSLGVPVIMEASDRCMVDVERFDLEPERPILHGIVKQIDIPTLKALTSNEEKIPYMLEVLGLETTTERLRASMLEMQQTINTWPQLASAVTMGGGITADVARRLLLDQFRSSGRYYVDVEQIICDEPGRRKHEELPAPQHVSPDLRAWSRNIAVTADRGMPLGRSTVEKLVEAGCMAPSAGNHQPWRWVYRNNGLYVFNPFAGETSLLQFENNAPYMAIGAAAMNVVLRAEELNLSTELAFFPDAKAGSPAMSFHFSPLKKSNPKSLALAGAVEGRVTNRNLAKRQPVAAQTLRDLQETVSGFDPNFHVRFFTDEKQLLEQGRILGELEKTRLLDPAWHREFVEELRWSEEETNTTRDGIDLNTLDLTNSERAGIMVARDPRVIAMVNEWNGGGAFSIMAKKAVASASAIGMICARQTSPDMFLKAGMAMERMWLDVTLKKLALQPMGAPVFMFPPVLQNRSESLSRDTVERLLALRPVFEKTFELDKNEREVFIFRLAIVQEPPARSLRKPVEEVLLYQEEE